MGMQWQMGGTRLDFDDIGLRGAYQPRHAALKWHHRSRASVQSRGGLAAEVGVDAARAKEYAHQIAVASCQAYGFSPAPVRWRLLRRATRRFRRRDGAVRRGAGRASRRAPA